jgi:hypothetical protein
VELVYRNTRPPKGIERTAFDIGRRGTVHSAVAEIDALANATGVKVEAIAAVAERHPGVRGLRHLETALDLVDVTQGNVAAA